MSAFRLYYTDFPVSEIQYRNCKARLIPFQYPKLDEALAQARDIKEVGGVVWEIDCDGGPSLNRDEIEVAIFARRADLQGRPKVR